MTALHVSGRYSVILSGVLPGMFLKFYLAFFLAYTLTFCLAFWHTRWHSISYTCWHSIWFYRHLFRIVLAFLLASLPLVQVRRCPLRSGAPGILFGSGGELAMVRGPRSGAWKKRGEGRRKADTDIKSTTLIWQSWTNNNYSQARYFGSFVLVNLSPPES